MKRILFTLMVLVCVILTGCQCNHDWIEINRTEPGCSEKGMVYFACSECDETFDETIPMTNNHVWVEASCDLAKHCSECGVQEGEAIGHTWVDATCTDPKFCSECNTTEGEALGHTVAIGLCDNCGYHVTLYGLYDPKDYHVFQTLKTVVDEFKNPTSVKVVKIHYHNEDDDVYHITLSAKNSFGGTTTDCYRVSSYSIMKSSTYSNRTDSDYHVSSINELLKKYCQSQGWK